MYPQEGFFFVSFVQQQENGKNIAQTTRSLTFWWENRLNMRLTDNRRNGGDRWRNHHMPQDFNARQPIHWEIVCCNENSYLIYFGSNWSALLLSVNGMDRSDHPLVMVSKCYSFSNIKRCHLKMTLINFSLFKMIITMPDGIFFFLVSVCAVRTARDEKL